MSRPQSIPTEEGVGVISSTGAFGEHFQLFDIASTEDDVLGFEGSDEETNDFGDILPPLWKLVPHRGLYDDLLTVGLHPPAAIVVDLDLLGLNPLAILKSLRAHAVLGIVPIMAVSQFDATLAGALAHGAVIALRASESSNWRSAFATLE